MMGPMDTTPAPKCRHKVPADRCPVHARIMADAPALVFDGEGREALEALLD